MSVIFQRFGLSRLHFVGIGGTGMSGIAEVLTRESGVEISGCDAALGEATERLSRLGVEVHEGHAADHLDDVDVLVISSAVPEDNVEVVAARRRGIPVVRRAEMLAELMRLKYGIAIAGTHGKTTTTSMVGAVVTEAGLDPTVIVGGRMRALGTGARRLDIQSEFMSTLIDSFKSGIGALVDADLEEASARLQALQVQQQLGIQALSIANQAPQNILALFR